MTDSYYSLSSSVTRGHRQRRSYLSAAMFSTLITSIVSCWSRATEQAVARGIVGSGLPVVDFFRIDDRRAGVC